MVPQAPRKTLIWFWAIVAVEIYQSSNHIWLLVFTDKTIPYAMFAATSVPRAIAFILMARHLKKEDWWRYLFTFDNIFGQTVILSILYAWMTISASGLDSGAFGARLATALLQPIHQLSFNTSFRCMTKFFPWSPVTILTYKFVRLYSAVVAVVLYLLVKQTPTVDISYNQGLLTRVPSWTSYKRQTLKNIAAKAAAESSEAGLQSSAGSLAEPLLSPSMGGGLSHAMSIDPSHAEELKSLRGI